MKLILRKRMLTRLLVASFAFLIFLLGWFYLDYYFNSMESSFDFELYLDPTGIRSPIGKTSLSDAIVFSGTDGRLPVELYLSNCPAYAECSLSVSNFYPTFTSQIFITPSESTPTGTYAVNVFAAGAGKRRTATLYVNVTEKDCKCSDWINIGCGLGCGSDMYLKRGCLPPDCDIETRCAYNASCGKDFTLESVPYHSGTYEMKAYYVINVTSFNKFSDYVYFSTDSCPLGAVCRYSASPVFVPADGFATTELQVIAPQGQISGSFVITTIGVAEGLVRSANSSLTIM